MVNVRAEDLSKSELHQLVRKAIRRAWFAARHGTPDCAESARRVARGWKRELDRRAEEREKLFNAGAEAVRSATGI